MPQFDTILETPPQLLVYLSRDVATQSRDLKRLRPEGVTPSSSCSRLISSRRPRTWKTWRC